MKGHYPHYHLVPKGVEANLRFRRETLLQAAEDRKFANRLREMCSEDIMFYCNAFCWTYDPRDQENPHKPFITYDFQDEAIDELCESIRLGNDVVMPKSRCMGASWMGLTVFEWHWHFRDGLSFLLISRNEDYVDKLGDPKALFWKIDYLHKRQPKWLLSTGRHLGRKDPGRKALHLENFDNGSVIDGESTTGDAGRGDRRTAMFIDEHAAFDVKDGYNVMNATRDTTRCRIFNSTPQGMANAFADVVHKTAARQVRMHWSVHPEYRKGLYRVVDGQVEILDESFRGEVSVTRKGWKEPRTFLFPDNYPFEMLGGGKMRSPWYDNECARCVSAMEIAQELDIDFLGSDYQFFDPQFIQGLIDQNCFDPLMVGNLEYDVADLEPLFFRSEEKGDLSLWIRLPGGGQTHSQFDMLSGRRFAVGADVSMGTGASNSVASVVDVGTGEKVAVFKSSHIEPKKFAKLCIALAKMFQNAKLIWDASGSTGRVFTKEVIELGYRKIYYRQSEGRIRKRMTDQPGMYLNPEDRAVLLQDYRQNLGDRVFINRSEPGMKETMQFIVQPGGKVEHSSAISSQDPTGARQAHGDEVIADALASRLIQSGKQEIEQGNVEVPEFSIAARLKEEREAELAASNADW